MSTAALKRELALLRSSLAADTNSVRQARRPYRLGRAHRGAYSPSLAARCPLSASPRLLLNATRQSGKSTTAALKAAWTVLQGGLDVVVSPSLRQSRFLFRKLTRHAACGAAFRRAT